jgi:murein DD-endopeptidase MepM/ murein hydrolase activator NlpD
MADGTLRTHAPRSLAILVVASVSTSLLAAPTGEADRSTSGGASATPANLKRAAGPSDPGAPDVLTAVSSNKAYVAGRKVRFSYEVAGSRSASVVVKVVRIADGSTLRTWNQGEVAPGAVKTLAWNAKDHGKTPPDDRYAFRLSAAGPSGATSRNAPDGDASRDAFDLHGYVFPLRGSHRYGDGFGVARSGHSHQGQDVFASCGTKIVAPRGGRVKARKYHPAAGNYVVIDGASTGRDFVFAHLREASPLDVGDRVYTGQKIGNVGETGNAVGCHLHYEMWSSPGWYSGGHPIDPISFLKAWDKYS